MLKLSGIKKDYVTGDTTVNALKGMDLEFRRNEFVAILGPSGCGKTTLLNIVGGLDQYTEGDLMINGRTTKEYTSRDWDTYRNHSVGFVFQSYNLIPHQTVLGNVELALTLSGVGKEERKRRATDALEKVGLKGQLKKLPNQLSGGQMQRVAIARAIVNDPEIILADEPTGALDTETSVQVMDILKELSSERLVIMVTHNPELADRYATRIIRLLDGEMVGDTNPYRFEGNQESEHAEAKAETALNPATSGASGKKPKRGRNADGRRASMSFATAFVLSLRNLFTKKARTFLTAFAGSIGIIGIALVLSLSAGFQGYIKNVEEETLSTYPITIEPQSLDFESIMESMGQGNTADKPEEFPDSDEAGIRDVLSKLKDMQASYTNDLKSFKKYLDSEEGRSALEGLYSDIKYSYPLSLNVFKNDHTANSNTRLNPFELPPYLFNGAMGTQIQMMMRNLVIWNEMLDNPTLINSQYETLRGHMPTKSNEIVIVVDKYNRLDDYTMFALGLISEADLQGVMMGTTKVQPVSFDELMQLKFKLLPNAAMYAEKDGSTGVFENRIKDKAFMNDQLNDAMQLEVVGIIREQKGVSAASIHGSIAYLPSLKDYLIDQSTAENYPVIAQQLANPMVDVLSGKTFEELNADQDKDNDATYEGNLVQLNSVDRELPTLISIYPAGFNEKDKIVAAIKGYNASVEESQAIKHTDYIGLMMSSVTTIINSITYVLVAFIAISLVVSSIMIGIITYISVLERTKEIGVLRSMGASKMDVSNVFNAETLIVGFIAGMFGIIVTLVLNIPINIIIYSLTGIANVSALPLLGGVTLIVISMLLTFIAGLIPSRIAAKKDPVVALRSE